MRDYNEIAQNVFRRRDEFVMAQKKKIGIMLKAGVPVCSLLLVSLVGAALWQGGRLPEVAVDTKPAHTLLVQETTGEEAATEMFIEATDATDPVEDSYNVGNDNTSQSTHGVSNSGSGNSTSADKPDNSPSNKPSDNNAVGGTTGGDRPATGGDSSSDDYRDPQGSATTPAEDNAEPPIEGGNESDVPMATAPPMHDDPEETLAVEATTACVAGEPEDEDFQEKPVVTKPASGLVEITLDGKSYDVQTGDKITVVTKLQTEGFVRSADARFYYPADTLEFVDLKDYGFTEHQLREVHFPEISGASTYISNPEPFNGERNVGASLALNTGGVSFEKETVLVVFDYIVKRTGTGEIKPEFYFEFESGYQNAEYTIDVELLITPASEVVVPTPPDVENNTQDEPFTYPEESHDGDLVINCGDRVYSANIGDTVTCVVEVEACELFEDIQLELRYGDGSLEFVKPDKSRENFPEMHGYAVGYLTHLNKVRFIANDIYGFDFTKRKVLLTLDFVVVKGGEIDIELEIEEMNLYPTSDAVFAGSTLVREDIINIYEYVVVK